jgi:hypothetical protein
MVAVVSSLLLVSACGIPAEPDEQESAPVPGTEEAIEEPTDVKAFWLSCPGYDGTPCTTPGNRFRCYNWYPTEPGICVCGQNYTYTCA